jgi:hypothetical protein
MPDMAAPSTDYRAMSLHLGRRSVHGAELKCSEIQRAGAIVLPVFPYLTNRFCPTYLPVRDKERLHGTVEDVMRLQLHCHSDIDLSQPGMQVEIRSHIARCLRDYPHGGEGVITLAGVEHCFMYVVQDDVVDTVIGPPDYIEQVLNERRQNRA